MTYLSQRTHTDASPRRRGHVRCSALTSAFLLALLLVAAPTAARGQFPAPTTTGIQATYASEETSPPKRMRARFPDHRIEGMVVGGALGVGMLVLYHALSKMNDGPRYTLLLDSPVVSAVAVTALGTFIGSVIPKQQ